MQRTIWGWVRGLLGAAVGGFVGYRLFVWIIGQGLYALVLPGALVGLGCGLMSTTRSTARGLVCAVIALAVGLLSEWDQFKFVADDSLGYFLTHVHQLKPITLLMIGLGAAFGYWWGRDAMMPWTPGPSPRRPAGPPNEALPE